MSEFITDDIYVSKYDCGCGTDYEFTCRQSIEMKPCPFCGTPRDDEKHVNQVSLDIIPEGNMFNCRVVCLECDAHGGTGWNEDRGESARQAINSWQRRS